MGRVRPRLHRVDSAGMLLNGLAETPSSTRGGSVRRGSGRGGDTEAALAIADGISEASMYESEADIALAKIQLVARMDAVYNAFKIELLKGQMWNGNAGSDSRGHAARVADAAGSAIEHALAQVASSVESTQV